MMTEEEARKKWCPHVRAGNAAGCNRSGHDFPVDPYCIASDCMSWRTQQEHRMAPYSQSGDVRQLGAQGWSVTESAYNVTASRMVGYCGLAGKP